MKCTYNINGKNYTYEQTIELLLNNMQSIKGGMKVSDVVYSKNYTQAEATQLLRNIKSSIILERSQNNFIDSSVDVKSNNSKYLSASEFLQTYKKVDGTYYVTPFNEKNYRESEINRMVAEGLDRTDAVKQIDETIASWEKIADHAYNIHSVVNSFFTYFKGMDDIYTKFSHLYSKEVLNNLVTNLDRVKNQIKAQLGDDVKIIPNITLDAKMVADNKNIIQNIDLVAIDSKGIPHVYLFKTATKSSGEILKVKEQYRDYLLATARHLLANKGFNAVDSTLNIIHINMDLDDNNELVDVHTENIINRTEENKQLEWGYGRIFNAVSQALDVDIDENVIVGSIKDKVISNLAKMFPSRNIDADKDTESIESFIKNKVKDSKKDGYQYAFENKITNDWEYISTSDAKESSAEVREAVVAYLKKRSDYQQTNFNRFINSIKQVIEGKKELSDLSRSSIHIGFVNTHFGRYTNGNWKLVEIPAITEMGVMLIQNTVTKQVDVIGLSHNSNLNNKINLGLGTTILGEFIKDQEGLIDENLIYASRGNIDLMKIMLVLNETSELFKRPFEVGNVSVVNLDYAGEASWTTPKQIKYSFSKLAEKIGLENKIPDINWMDDLIMLNSSFIDILSSNINSNDSEKVRTVFSMYEGLDPSNKDAAQTQLIKIASLLEKQYSGLFNRGFDNSKGFTPMEHSILRLYIDICYTIDKLGPSVFHQIEEIAKYTGSFKEKAFLNGKYTSTPDTFTDQTLYNVAKLFQRSIGTLRIQFTKFGSSFREQTLKEYWDYKGFTQAQNMIVGNQSKLYNNLYRRKDDGKLEDLVMFKNPYTNPDNSLDAGEVKFLKEALWIINKERFNLKESDRNTDVELEARESERWFWVPLQEANSKLTQNGVLNTIKDSWKDLTEMTNRFRMGEHEEYSEDEVNLHQSSIEQYELFNRYSFSDADEDSRIKLLESQELSFWELNLENIVLQYKFAYMRKKIFDEVLPYAKVYKTLMKHYSDSTGTKSDNVREALDDYIKIAIHNASIINPESQWISALAKNVRFITSSTQLIGNLVSVPRDTFEGIFKMTGVFLTGYWGDKKGFGVKDYAKAFKMVNGDWGRTTKGVTTMEALNMSFGIANMDINTLAQRMKTNKNGVMRFQDKMFITVTIGDYLNRMSLLVAKMNHDGSFDACGYDNTGLTYDWKKDKRFSALANNNTSDPKYKEQRSLYLSMMQEFIDDGLAEKLTDDLPLPYTNTDILAVKRLGNTLYGYFDHESKM